MEGWVKEVIKSKEDTEWNNSSQKAVQEARGNLWTVKETHAEEGIFFLY